MDVQLHIGLAHNLGQVWLYKDNELCIKLVHNPNFHSKTKHMTWHFTSFMSIETIEDLQHCLCTSKPIIRYPNQGIDDIQVSTYKMSFGPH
jgi:hypothetical protein